MQTNAEVMSKQDDSKRIQLFLKFKEECLKKEDLSRKGSIDEPIRDLVEIINKSPYYYTTSTCSGRITLIDKPYENAGIKKGSKFHLNKHDSLNVEEFVRVVSESSEQTNGDREDKCLWLKFEPFIVHIQCFDLDRAKQLLTVALATGSRNSGLTLGKPDKYMLAIRSTSSMEVPLRYGSRFKLDSSYLEFLCDETNRRMRENLIRLQKLQQSVRLLLSLDTNQD